MERGAGHAAVLVRQVVEALAPTPAALIVDCTVGLGGHAQALLEAAGTDSQLIGLDLDEGNLRAAHERLSPFGSRVRLFSANFAQVDEVLAQAGAKQADVLLADLGISSTQLDDPARGLSFSADGPLDMRLDQSSGRTAADLVNMIGEQELADVIYCYGEERYSRRIARAIVAARRTGRIERTLQLSEIIERSLPPIVRHQRRGAHPSTRTFQALRIEVNRELESLETLLRLLPRVVAPGGRAGIISFHSLEDRLVKQAFLNYSNADTARILTKKPITADSEEIAENPRSRSAKLRGLQVLFKK